MLKKNPFSERNCMDWMVETLADSGCCVPIPCLLPLGRHSTKNSAFNYYFSGYFPKLERFFPSSLKSWQQHSRGLVHVMYSQLSIFVVVTFYNDANIELVNTKTSVVNVSSDTFFALLHVHEWPWNLCRYWLQLQILASRQIHKYRICE